MCRMRSRRNLQKKKLVQILGNQVRGGGGRRMYQDQPQTGRFEDE